MSQSGLVLVERPQPHIALVLLNRPERMNSMAFDVMLPLREAFAELNHDNDVRVVVLTGAGHGFSSGADHKSAGAVPHVEGLTRPSFGLRSTKFWAPRSGGQMPGGWARICARPGMPGGPPT